MRLGRAKIWSSVDDGLGFIVFSSQNHRVSSKEGGPSWLGGYSHPVDLLAIQYRG